MWHEPALGFSQQTLMTIQPVRLTYFGAGRGLFVLLSNHKALNQTTSTTPICHAASRRVEMIFLSCYSLLVNAPLRLLRLMVMRMRIAAAAATIFCHQCYLCLAN